MMKGIGFVTRVLMMTRTTQLRTQKGNQSPEYPEHEFKGAFDWILDAGAIPDGIVWLFGKTAQTPLV